MVRRSVDSASVEDEVAALGKLDLYAMRDRWHQLFGNPPPKSLRLAFLLKACAYQTRTLALGGLSASTRRRLLKIAEGVRSGRTAGIVEHRRVSPGTRLVRSWRGQNLRGDYAGRWPLRVEWSDLSIAVSDRQGDHRHQLEWPRLLRFKATVRTGETQGLRGSNCDP